jgi:hypothetical protein
MHTHILVEWDTNNSHTSCSDVSDKCDKRECGGAVDLVTVDNVLIRADEDAENAITEDNGSNKR